MFTFFLLKLGFWLEQLNFKPLTDSTQVIGCPFPKILWSFVFCCQNVLYSKRAYTRQHLENSSSLYLWSVKSSPAPPPCVYLFCTSSFSHQILLCALVMTLGLSGHSSSTLSGIRAEKELVYPFPPVRRRCWHGRLLAMRTKRRYKYNCLPDRPAVRSHGLLSHRCGRGSAACLTRWPPPDITSPCGHAFRKWHLLEKVL